MIFYYSYEASAHVLTELRTCLSHLHAEKSIPCLLLSFCKELDDSTLRKRRIAFLILLYSSGSMGSDLIFTSCHETDIHVHSRQEHGAQYIPPLSDINGTAIEAKCHNFDPV